MKLYDYFRSTASYRVRIALNVKKISYDKLAVHLVNNGGEQHHADYLALNPQALVPTLQDNGHILTQSLAIIEYLDEISPNPPLLPRDPLARAQVRSMALIIACDIHPLNNLRVLTQLRQQFNAKDTDIKQWYHHWLTLGFDAIEKTLAKNNNKHPFCYSNSVSMADVCLIPQVYNAQRFEFPMDNYPLIKQINENCLTMDTFQCAAPQQ